MRKLLAALLIFCSCTKVGKQTDSTDNVNFQVDFLFEHNGFKIYRFYDGGHDHYFIEPKGQVMTEQPSGKVTYPESIITK